MSRMRKDTWHFTSLSMSNSMPSPGSPRPRRMEVDVCAAAQTSNPLSGCCGRDVPLEVPQLAVICGASTLATMILHVCVMRIASVASLFTTDRYKAEARHSSSLMQAICVENSIQRIIKTLFQRVCTNSIDLSRTQV